MSEENRIAGLLGKVITRGYRGARRAVQGGAVVIAARAPCDEPEGTAADRQPQNNESDPASAKPTKQTTFLDADPRRPAMPLAGHHPCSQLAAYAA